MTAGTNPKLRVAHVMGRQSGNSNTAYELRAGRETRGLARDGRMRRISLRPSSIRIVIKPRVTMKEKLTVK